MSGDARFVAVEFDTHQDPWDSSSRHIGIGIDENRGDYKVLPDGRDTGLMSATIVHNNSTRRPDVALIVGSDTYTTTATVDLPSLLPEHVASCRLLGGDREYTSNHASSSLISLHRPSPPDPDYQVRRL